MGIISFRDEDKFKRLKGKWKIINFLEKEGGNIQNFAKIPLNNSEISLEFPKKLTVSDLRKIFKDSK